jgi:predicted nicotinamide N-methyase
MVAGVRLLVVVSDGCYTDDETQRAKQWIQRCHEAGVGVLWMPMGPRDYYAESIIKGTDAIMLPDTLDPAKAALEIGKAAAKALEKVNARKAA